MSNPSLAYKGVPQGGVLSPLLYLIYVLKIADKLPLNFKLLQFADDIAIYKSANNVGPSVLHKFQNFRNAIKMLNNNSLNLSLEISPSKTGLMC